MVKMERGECRCTRAGVKYCYTPRGVRFVGKCSESPEPEPEYRVRRRRRSD